jgi:hypothetical protein
MQRSAHRANPLIRAPPNEDEPQKIIFAEVRKGSQAIILDNWINRIHGGPALCSFLTASTFGGHILSVSENQTAATQKFRGDELEP